MLNSISTLNCRGRLLDLSDPIVMGILNMSPDSFFDGGKNTVIEDALRSVEKMIEEGAQIIDIGGMSSRPGADLIPEDEEQRRVIPVIKAIVREFQGTVLSIDTIRSEIARMALDEGAHIINDISGWKYDESMLEILADYKVPYILMHMQGDPNNMQASPKYDDVVDDLMEFFLDKIETLKEIGLNDIIIDPGFGFGKSVEHNYALLKNLKLFQSLDCLILAGVSRKSMICKVLEIDPVNALNGTTALHMLALQNGANILRAHDVKEAVEVIKLWKTYSAAD